MLHGAPCCLTLAPLTCVAMNMVSSGHLLQMEILQTAEGVGTQAEAIVGWASMGVVEMGVAIIGVVEMGVVKVWVVQMEVVAMVVVQVGVV